MRPRKTCRCGSGEDHYPLMDARGIFCGYVCSQCETQYKKKFRPEVFTNPNYWTTENVEEDD